MTVLDLSRRLTVVTEGGAHSFEYFVNNGVLPSSILFSAVKFKEVAPYLSSDDVILVVIKGLTDFSLAEVYGLIDDLEIVRSKVAEITIVSNVDLGYIESPYYLYKGDLFYGKMTEMSKGKKVVPPKQKSDTSEKSGKKSSTGVKNSVEPLAINTVMSRYKVFNKNYNNTDNKPKVYGGEKPVTFEVDTLTDLVRKSVVFVDAFGDS